MMHGYLGPEKVDFRLLEIFHSFHALEIENKLKFINQ